MNTPSPMIWTMGLCLLPPCAGADQHQHGEDLQPADEHTQAQHELAHIAEGGEVAGGADHAQAGADIGQRGDDGGEVGLKGKAVQ